MNHASNSDSPLITIAIPTCNRPALLKRAIESVQASSFQNWKICISDDGEPKLGQEFINGLKDPRIRYQTHERAGMVPNWEAVCRMADTPYVFKLDDDDTIAPEFLETTVGFLEKHPEVCIVYTGFWVLPEDGSTHLAVDQDFFANRQIVDGLEYVRAFLLNEGYPQNHKSAGVFRRSRAEHIEWFKYAREDITFSLAMALGGKVGYLPEPLFFYRVRWPGQEGTGQGMAPSVYETVLTQFNELFSWPFVRDIPELVAIEPLARRRLNFAVPLLNMAKSLRYDRWEVFWKKYEITRKHAKIERVFVFWLAVILLWPIPHKFFYWLTDWYGRTNWIKVLLNKLIS